MNVMYHISAASSQPSFSLPPSPFKPLPPKAKNLLKEIDELLANPSRFSFENRVIKHAEYITKSLELRKGLTLEAMLEKYDNYPHLQAVLKARLTPDAKPTITSNPWGEFRPPTNATQHTPLQTPALSPKPLKHPITMANKCAFQAVDPSVLPPTISDFVTTVQNNRSQYPLMTDTAINEILTGKQLGTEVVLSFAQFKGYTHARIVSRNLPEHFCATNPNELNTLEINVLNVHHSGTKDGGHWSYIPSK